MKGTRAEEEGKRVKGKGNQRGKSGEVHNVTSEGSLDEDRIRED